MKQSLLRFAIACCVMGSLRAQELVVNGDFANGLTNWTQASWAGGSVFGLNTNGPTDTSAASGNYAYAGGGTYNLLQQSISGVTNGGVYRLTFMVGSKSGEASTYGLLSLYDGLAGSYNSASFNYRPSSAAFGTYTVDFVARGATDLWLRNDGGGYAAYDNVSLTPIAGVAHALNYSAASGITEITSVLAGSGKVTVNAGVGGLTLKAANTYTGATEVSGGTLYVTDSGTLGAAGGAVTVSGSGKLDLRNLQTRTGPISMNSQDARILSGTGTGSLINNGGALQLGGGQISLPVSGTGGLNITGGGQITSSNSYTGATTISATEGWYGTGTFYVANAHALGAAAGDLTVSGGTVSLQGNTVTRSGNVTISGGRIHTGTLVKSGGDYDIRGGLIEASLAGPAGLTKSGSGTAVLAAANTYTGGTLVAEGALQISDGGSVTGGITNNAALLFDGTGNATVNNAISGTGTVTKTGAGTVTLAGSNSYRGNTTIAAGKLVVTGSNTNSAVTVQSGGALGGSGALGVTTIRSGGTIAPGEAEPSQSPMYQNAVAADAAIWPNVNWASFDQDKVVSFGNFQYAVYWDADRVLTVVRRNLTSNQVQQVRLTDYVLADGLATSEQSNGHRNAVIGLSPIDGRIHLAWDHHNNSLNYTRSRQGLITDPPATITAADFEPKQPIAGAPATVTYPTFLNDHQDGLMFLCRSGGSGSGDIVFFEYDATSGGWTVVAERLFGSTGTYAGWNNSTSRNAYLHDILFDGNGRLHVSWVWREVASTWASNHDLNYAYSDDRGRTWKNNAGVQIADVTRGEQITIDSPGIIVWSIPVYSWLMNQCGMTLDSRNNPHVATYHMEEVLVPETVAHDPPPAERWRLNYYHYWRDDNGVWHRRGPLPKPASADRPVIVAAPDDTIVIYFRTADGIMAHAASARSGWTDWRTHVMTGPEYTYLDASKPDRRRLKESNILSLTADPNALTGGPRGFAFLDFPVENFTRSPEQYGTTGAFDAPAGLVLEEGARLSLRVNSAGDYSFVTSGSIDLRGEVHVHFGRDYAPMAGDTFAFLRGPLTGDVAWVLPNLDSEGLKWEEGVGDARGTLRIANLSGPGPLDIYEQWADSYELSGADRVESADPDGDGLSNMREFALGGNPSAPDVEKWLVSRDGTNLVFSWLQRTDGAVSYALLEHADLVTGPWLASSVAVEPAAGPAAPQGYEWKRISVPASGKKFFRVEASMPQRQSITFEALPTKTHGLPVTTFSLDAFSSSGLPITYTSSNSSVASVSGNTVTIVGVGTTTITARQSGNSAYGAATPVRQVLTVAPRTSLTVDAKVDFGAVGDGVADDTVALQSALDYLASNIVSDGGGCLVLPSGTYRITNRLNFIKSTGPAGMNQGITIRGAESEGPGASIIYSAGTAGALYFDVNDTEGHYYFFGVRVQDLQIQAGAANAGAAIEIKRMPAIDNIQSVVPFIKNVAITTDTSAKYFDYGVVGRKVLLPEFTDVRVTGTRGGMEAGIYLDLNYSFTVNNCRITDADKGIDAVRGGEGNDIMHTVISNVNTGINMHVDPFDPIGPSSLGGALYGCDIAAWDTGVIIDHKGYFPINDNNFTSLGTSASYRHLTLAKVHHVIVTDNTFTGASNQTGVRVESPYCWENTIAYNDFGSLTNAVGVTAGANDTMILDNSPALAPVTNAGNRTYIRRNAPRPFKETATRTAAYGYQPGRVLVPWNQMVRGPVVKVTDYGANGLDALDDTTAIQNAANALRAALNTGGQGTLYFPAGLYRLSARVDLTQGGANWQAITIAGDGCHVTGIAVTGMQGVFKIDCTQQVPVFMHGFRIDPLTSNPSTAIEVTQQNGALNGNRSLHMQDVGLFTWDTRYFSGGFKGIGTVRPFLQNVLMRSVGNDNNSAFGIQFNDGYGFDWQGGSIYGKQTSGIIESLGGEVNIRGPRFAGGGLTSLTVDANGGSFSLNAAHIDSPVNLRVTDATDAVVINALTIAGPQNPGFEGATTLEFRDCSGVYLRDNILAAAYQTPRPSNVFIQLGTAPLTCNGFDLSGNMMLFDDEGNGTDLFPAGTGINVPAGNLNGVIYDNRFFGNSINDIVCDEPSTVISLLPAE